jgi:Holliday junction DNA helicase RuvA
MYDFFIGKVAAKTPTSVVLEVGGVGYRFEIPLSTYDKIREAGGGPVRLLAHLHVREDALRLYGFATEDERRLFQHLIEIKGIGPQIALNILSGTSVGEFVQALRAGDTRFFDKIRGVGKKTAERVLLELREKAEALAPGGSTPALVGPADDAVRALVSLGYTPVVARKAVDAAIEARGARGSGTEARVEELVKEALRHAG